MNNPSFHRALRKKEQGMTGARMFWVVIVTQITSFSAFWHVLRCRAVRWSPGASAHPSLLFF